MQLISKTICIAIGITNDFYYIFRKATFHKVNYNDVQRSQSNYVSLCVTEYLVMSVKPDINVNEITNE